MELNLVVAESARVSKNKIEKINYFANFRDTKKIILKIKIFFLGLHLEFLTAKAGLLKIFELLLGSCCETLLIRFGMSAASEMGQFHNFMQKFPIIEVFFNNFSFFIVILNLFLIFFCRRSILQFPFDRFGLLNHNINSVNFVHF